MKLSELKQGETAVITQCADRLPLKVPELGCLAGRSITYLYRSPWGSPRYYRLGHQLLALDQRLADLIHIQKTDDEQKMAAAGKSQHR